MSRVAVVTGAASGVGLATSKRLADDGCAVVGVDRAPRPATLDIAQAPEWVQGDVGTVATWDQVLEAVMRRDPNGADVLCACAGITHVASFLETGAKTWSELFDVNVLGVVRAMQAVIPAMVARGGGAIAVVCSVDSFFVEDGLSAYAASKAALLQVVRSAALEHARDDVRINAVCPGAIDTPMFRGALAAMTNPSAALDAVLRRTPTGALLQPHEVASVMSFLVGDGASGVTGAAVIVDGGLTTTYDYAPPSG